MEAIRERWEEVGGYPLEVGGGEVQGVGELAQRNLGGLRVEVPAQRGQNHHLHILKQRKHFKNLLSRVINIITALRMRSSRTAGVANCW